MLCTTVVHSSVHANMLTGGLEPVGLGLISFYVCFLMIFFLTKVSLLVLWLVILCFWLFGSSLVVSTGAVDCLDLRSLKPGFHYPS